MKERENAGEKKLVEVSNYFSLINKHLVNTLRFFLRIMHITQNQQISARS